MENRASSPREERVRATIEVLIRVMRLHHRVIERRIDGLGVHHSQHRTLMQLSHMGGAASQKDIAEALDVSPACVARTLKALCAAGLIDKSEGEDGRCREIDILPEGRRLIDDSENIFHQIDDEMFEGVSDEDILRLAGILVRIHKNLCDMVRAEAEGSEKAP